MFVSAPFQDNKVAYIDNQLLTGLNKLEKVDLSFNYLQKVDDKTFEDLPRLTHVDLSGNRLLSITPKTFKGMYALQSLSLYYNDFTSLPDGFLRDSKKLQHLNLRRNRLETVTLDMLHGLKVIRPDFILDVRSKLRPRVYFSKSILSGASSSFWRSLIHVRTEVSKTNVSLLQ